MTASMPVPGMMPPPRPTKFTIPLDRNPDVRKPDLGANEPKAKPGKPRDPNAEKAAEIEERVASLVRTADGRALARLVVSLKDRVDALERAIAPH